MFRVYCHSTIHESELAGLGSEGCKGGDGAVRLLQLYTSIFCVSSQHTQESGPVFAGKWLARLIGGNCCGSCVGWDFMTCVFIEIQYSKACGTCRNQDTWHYGSSGPAILLPGYTKKVGVS